MNLLLHGIEDFAVERGDTLRQPIFTDPASGGLATFNCVIANPPFSLEQWGREVWENDPWGRAFAGLPSDSSGDFVWVPDRARVVSVEEIKAEDWTLNISCYVLPPLGEDIPPLPQAIADFKAVLARVREALIRLNPTIAAQPDRADEVLYRCSEKHFVYYIDDIKVSSWQLMAQLCRY